MKIFNFIKKNPIKVHVLGVIIFALFSNSAPSQIIESTPIKVDLNLILSGISKIKSFPDGAPLGIGINFKHNKLVLGGQALRTRKFIHNNYESTKYYNFDLFFGMQKSFNKVNTSLSSGIGISTRNSSDPEYSNLGIPYEEKYLVPALPIKLDIEYSIYKSFTFGIISYANINPEVKIYGFLFNIGYTL